MSDYTLINLKKVTDMAPKFGYAPNLESRFARTALELENSGLSHFKIAPGFRIPFGHVHSEQEEVYLVLEGSALVSSTTRSSSSAAGMRFALLPG